MAQQKYQHPDGRGFAAEPDSDEARQLQGLGFAPVDEWARPDAPAPADAGAGKTAFSARAEKAALKKAADAEADRQARELLEAARVEAEAEAKAKAEAEREEAEAERERLEAARLVLTNNVLTNNASGQGGAI